MVDSCDVVVSDFKVVGWSAVVAGSAVVGGNSIDTGWVICWEL